MEHNIVTTMKSSEMSQYTELSDHCITFAPVLSNKNMQLFGMEIKTTPNSLIDPWHEALADAREEQSRLG